MIETTIPYSSNDIRRGILVRGGGRGRSYGQGIHNKSYNSKISKDSGVEELKGFEFDIIVSNPAENISRGMESIINYIKNIARIVKTLSR